MAEQKPFVPQWPKPPVLTEDDAKADLRGVHWQLSFVDHGPGKSEARQNYVDKGFAKPDAFDHSAELKASHIDLAVGCDRSCKHWQSSLTAEMSRNEESKFACGQPKGFDELAHELRKSSVSFSDRAIAPSQSEQKCRFNVPPKVEQAPNVAETVGKDLRASHIDISNGGGTSCAHWQAAGQAEMSAYAKEKFECKKPGGFEALGKELRKSSVPLGANLDPQY
eukprot:TRINITY_DN21856_c0_g1_i1.p1 TRINITY_DN21856_c0_g1~~TRINITY_DN21856_c0_g1_i1.p1  ORF type:complete len:223 (+),score=57.54 TRINITY_DN21856_c0_g1_i1:49-717(+)